MASQDEFDNDLKIAEPGLDGANGKNNKNKQKK
jgi:hypothetical protein